VKRGTKRLYIGSERYIGGSMCLIVMMRPAPTLQLAFQMRTGVGHLRRTLTDWVFLENMKSRNDDALYEFANLRHLYAHQKTPLRHLYLLTSISNA
jgi:hypothetical protein